MLIYGINPYTISHVTVTKFRRMGKHPLYYRLRNRKHPICSMFWDGAADTFDGIWQRPEVVIHGADGGRLLAIETWSNNRAKQLAAEIRQQLESAISCKQQQ